MSEKWTPPSWAAPRAQDEPAARPRLTAAVRDWRRQTDPLGQERAHTAQIRALMRTPGVVMMRAHTARRSEQALSTDQRRAA
jgi:hypothetical protein